MKSKTDKKKEKVLLELIKANVTDFDYSLLDEKEVVDTLADCIENYEIHN
jgi:hypothetical protein